MPHPPIRHVGAAVLAVGMLVGTAGCNNGSGTGAGTAPNAAHQSHGRAAPTALTRQEFAASVTKAQANAGSAHVVMTMRVNGQVAKITGDESGLESPSHSAARIRLAAGGKRLQMLLVHKLMYIKGLPMARPSKPWVKLDLSDPNSPFGPLFKGLSPSSFTTYLKGVKRFRDLGIETVDGVRARHYALTVDAAKLAASNPMLKGQDASALGLPKSVTTQIWLDGQNRVVQLVLKLGSAGSLQAQLSRYGEAVHVTAPPANQVASLHL